MSNLAEQYHKTMNKLSKWKIAFASWQLGTRSSDDPECAAVKDHREVTIIVRCELTAFTDLCIRKGIFTLEEFQEATIKEAVLLEKDYEKAFPGFRANDIGMSIDVQKAWDTVKNWKP